MSKKTRRLLPRFRKHQQQGITLLEIVLTLGLLMLVAGATAELMQANFTIREALSQENSVTTRVSGAMQRVVWDLQHTYLLERNDIRRPDGRLGGMRAATIFKVDPGRGDSQELRFTTKANRPMRANYPESDTVYVVYKVEESRTFPGRFNLLRGATNMIPEDFREDPPLRVIARHIKSFQVDAWRGDDWVQDRWDSTRGEWRDLLPHMVRVRIDSFVDAPPEDLAASLGQDLEDLSVTIETIVHIPIAFTFTQLRPMSGTVRWDRL